MDPDWPKEPQGARLLHRHPQQALMRRSLADLTRCDPQVELVGEQMWVYTLLPQFSPMF